MASLGLMFLSATAREWPTRLPHHSLRRSPTCCHPPAGTRIIRVEPGTPPRLNATWRVFASWLREGRISTRLTSARKPSSKPWRWSRGRVWPIFLKKPVP